MNQLTFVLVAILFFFLIATLIGYLQLKRKFREKNGVEDDEVQIDSLCACSAWWLAYDTIHFHIYVCLVDYSAIRFCS